MYPMIKDTFDFNPAFSGDRSELVEIQPRVMVPRVGNCVIETYSMNGRWFGFSKVHSDLRAMAAAWMVFPWLREFFAEMFRYGVKPTPTAVYCGSYQLKIKNGDEVTTPAAGTKLLAKNPRGVYCGFGEVEQGGLLKFMPVYGEDPYTPGIEGCAPGEEFTLYMAISFSTGEIRLHTETPLTWTGNGASIVLPLLSLQEFGKVLVEK